MVNGDGAQDLTNVQAVILALYRCGGDQSAIHTEDVAVAANELAPGRFAWTKYPDQISLEHVRVALSDAKKPNNGELVAGDGTQGWHLTPAGRLWAAAQPTGTARVPERQRIDQDTARRIRMERARIMDTDAWASYQAGKEVGKAEARAVFRASDYLRPDRMRLLIDRQVNLFAADPEMAPFVNAMATAALGDEGAL